MTRIDKLRTLFLFVFIVCALLLLIPVLAAQEEEPPEEEEPIQTYPNPLKKEMNDARAMKVMKTDLEDMGFRVGRVKRVGKGRFTVAVQGWNQVKMKPRFKGSVTSTQTKKKAQQGRGTVKVIVTKKGIYFSNKSFKAMGLKMNAAKMKKAAPIKNAVPLEEKKAAPVRKMK